MLVNCADGVIVPNGGTCNTMCGANTTTSCGLAAIPDSMSCVPCAENAPQPNERRPDKENRPFPPSAEPGPPPPPSGPGPGGPAPPPQPDCTSGCSCPIERGEPVSVGGGRHTLHPITLVSVQGPWRVPLEFTLHYSDTNEWAPTLHSEGLGGLSVIEDNAYLARGWTHTLSEAIVGIKTDLPATDSSWSPDTFPWTTANPCQAAERVPGKRLLYRHPEGGYDEFGFATSGTGGDSCAVDGGNILLSSRRGTPYRLRVINFASSTREFELTDLRTGIVTKFDRHGRILSKKARTGPGASAWFGWTVRYHMMDSVDARRRRIGDVRKAVHHCADDQIYPWKLQGILS